jgi:CMP-N-acetylneuraminic acid synthetase
MVTYVIPARAGSKGLPYKNRKLLKYTLESLPKKFHNRTVITTDDGWIIDRVKDTRIKVIDRDPELAQDESSVKDVLLDVKRKMNLYDDDDLVLLYLTYPERTYRNIRSALQFYRKHDAKSLLCKKPAKTHPYLCLEEKKGHKGKQVVDHNLYRRQDYPDVFELSHFVAIQSVGELENLNDNLYNEDTVFFPIQDVVDVDYPSDLKDFEESN